MAVSVNGNISNNDYSSKGLSNTSSTSSGRTQGSNNGPIRLTSGSTLSGEVVSKDGSKVTIKVNNNQYISAKLDGNADVSVGQKLTFEVSKSASNQVILRPLYSNLSNNSAASMALKEAMLPINESTVALTSEMMKEGMAINVNALNDMYKNLALYPNADPKAIVQMAKIGIPITEANISQYENYMNLTHQVINNVESLADGLPGVIKDTMAAGGNLAENLGITREILNLVDTQAISNMNNISQGENSSLDISVTDGNTMVNQGEGVVDNSGSAIINSNLPLSENEQITLLNNINEVLELAGKEPLSGPLDAATVIETLKGLVNDNIAANITQTDVQDISLPIIDTNADDVLVSGQENQGAKVSDNIDTSVNGNAQVDIDVAQQSATADTAEQSNNNVAGLFKNLGDQVKLFGQKMLFKESNISEVATAEKQVIDDSDQPVEKKIYNRLSNILSSESFGKILSDSIKSQMVMNPADVAKEGKIEEFYNKLLSQSEKVTELMNAIGKGDSEVAKAATDIRDNISFMNQLNEFVNYVQLPLKMAGEDAHGELYVYTKRKSLAENNGNFTALLHLDMEHLGPMDVYVAMSEYTKVNTHFYLQTDELLDFIESHISELTDRLSKLGYSATASATKKSEGITAPLTEEFVKDDSGKVSNVVSKFCFDVRA